MDNLTSNKRHLPSRSWGGQNGWSSTSTQGRLFSAPPDSQHLNLGSSSRQRPSYNHLQVSSQSYVSDNTYHSDLYKTSHISSNPLSLFTNAAILSTSDAVSFDQQSSHASSLLLAANQGNTVPLPSLPQQDQELHPQHLPFFSTHNPYKASFQPPVTNQCLPNGLEDLPSSLPSCGQRLRTSQAPSKAADMESASFAGYTQSNASSSQEQPQWTPPSRCKGAADKSVPDATAHSSNEQEDNVTPPASSEKRRSALLNQRAQLLKQLEEMDKLLESVPQEDSSDEQSPHPQSPSVDDSSECEQTKTSETQQNKSEEESHLSEGSLSPSFCDEQEQETVDMPEDQMSTGESEDNTSIDYDFDSTCAPISDDEVSDYQPDVDEHSSNESSCSTSGDKRPPVSGKKRNNCGSEKSDSSLHEDESACPVKKACTTDEKSSTDAVELPTFQPTNSKEGISSKKNYCLFCSRSYSKMARHLERLHSDKAEVAAAFQYPKKSRERYKIWSKLINEGNFAHNKEVLRKGKGQLAVRKRPKHPKKATDFIHCLYCRGLYWKKDYFKHLKKCPEKNQNEARIGRKSLTVQCALEATDIGVSDGFKGILCGMIYDDVTHAVMNDKIILQFGEQMFNQYRSDEKKHSYVRQNLRHLGRLVLEAAKTTPLKNLEEFFYLSSFQYVVSAVNVLAGYDPERKSYSIPSLALKLGYHLQKACMIVEDNAAQGGDEGRAESARKFLSAYQKKWNKLISSGALTTLKETRLITEKNKPCVQDVKRLNFHVENAHRHAEKQLRQTPSAENYATLAKVMLARIILFNKRKGREVSSIQLPQFVSRKKTDVGEDMDISVTDLEITMCGFFPRIDIRGTTGRMLPVLLKPSFVSALELLVDVREKCGVPSENSYLFGRPNALSAYGGAISIQNYVKECGAKNCEALTLRKIQAHFGTMLQLINLDEDEACQILGPDNQVQALRQNSDMELDDVGMFSGGSQLKDKHKWGGAEVCAVERHMICFIEGHKVPQKHDCIKCLEAEPEALKTRTWKGVKNYVRNRITTLQKQRDSPSVVSAHRHRPQQVKQRHETPRKTEAHSTEPLKSSKSKDKDSDGFQKKDKHKWGEAEVRAVERHMMRFIQGHKVPQKNDCIQCLEAEPEVLRTRTWKGVKDFVRNRITTLQRQRDSPRVVSTNRQTKQVKQTPRKTEAHKTPPPKSSKSKEKGSQNKDKHKWGEAEVNAVERHLMRFIQGQKVPQKNDCVQCLAAEPHALKSRNWKGVKDYVRNRITALKRQSGSSYTML